MGGNLKDQRPRIDREVLTFLMILGMSLEKRGSPHSSGFAQDWSMDIDGDISISLLRAIGIITISFLARFHHCIAWVRQARETKDDRDSLNLCNMMNAIHEQIS